jgi:hypothetical protein
MKPILTRALTLALTGTLWLSLPASGDYAPGSVFYRYTDEQGVKVLSQSIPPEHVPNGYEVISRSGRVLKVVAPAPSGEDAARVAEERRLKEEQDRWDAELRRRYSTVADIEAAKTRNLAELQGNISILQGNLSSVYTQIEQQQAQAANLERSGREVTDTILKNLSDLAQEEQYIKAQIRQREEELQAVSDRFDRNIERFQQINRRP